jgi:hypothetical protein
VLTLCRDRPPLGLAFKLIQGAEKTWRHINGPDKIKSLLDGLAFRDGDPVKDDQPAQQKVAAWSLCSSSRPYTAL